jgi:hypothetical protein
MKSKKSSFEGYNFKIWMKKNKDNLKLLAAGLIGLIVSSFGDTAFVQFLFGGAGAVGTKLIMDSIDFFTSEVKI